MQRHTACQVNPIYFKPYSFQFPASELKTAAFPEGGGAVIFIFLSRENPVKYTDPDGRIPLNVVTGLIGTANATREMIKESAQEIYKYYPEILKAVNQFFEGY
jgi:hypothetical protein